MKFFLIAGEPSGDRLGAALIQGFDKRLSYPADFIGVGGTNMMEMGFESLFPMEEISIMGVGEILSRYFSLKNVLHRRRSPCLMQNLTPLLRLICPNSISASQILFANIATFPLSTMSRRQFGLGDPIVLSKWPNLLIMCWRYCRLSRLI